VLDTLSKFCYNIHMKRTNNEELFTAPLEIAMDRSDGSFAWHLFGVLLAAENKIDLEAEAASYLDTFYPGWEEEARIDAYDDEDHDYEPCEPDNWADENALASAGMGMDESY
tara:strand:+ start:4021 stop:4356 length:336 start_codon:yes stop_codon:yes gene_type:complete